MALATSEDTKITDATPLPAAAKRFNLRVQIAAADMTILSGSEPEEGLTTLLGAVTLADIPGGPWFVTLSRTIPVLA